MSRFQTLLERVGAELALPGRTRVEILEELAGDLDELYARYRAEGHDDEEALRRASERLGPSADAVRELVLVHAPVYRRLVERYARPGVHRIERALFVLLGLASAAFAGAALGPRALDDPSPFLVPLLLLEAGAFAIVFAKLFQLWVARDHRPAALARGLPALLALSLAAPFLALQGTLIDLYGAAAAIEAEPVRQGALLLRWVRQDGTLLAAALALSLVALGAWFGLRRRVSILSAAERRATSGSVVTTLTVLH